MKKGLIIILFGGLCNLSGLASFPLMHAYLACQWIEKHCPTYSQEDKVSFMCGTLFPDIYHIGVFDRDVTHKKNVVLEDVKKCSSSFQAGIMLHSFVDEERTKFLKIYKTDGFFPSKVSEGEYGLMILEDQCIKSKMDQKFKQHNWLKRKYDINKEEYLYKANKRYLSFWHYFVYRYFVSEPQDIIQYVYYCSFVTFFCPNLNAFRFFVGLGQSAPIVKKRLQDRKREVDDYVNAMTFRFDELFDKVN